MNTRRKIHDGIVGAVITIGTWLGYSQDPVWLWVPGILGATLLQSGITGFCPLYFILDRCPLESQSEQPANQQS